MTSSPDTSTWTAKIWRPRDLANKNGETHASERLKSAVDASAWASTKAQELKGRWRGEILRNGVLFRLILDHN